MNITGTHGKKPWQPQLETQAEFNPFVSPIATLGESEPRLLDAEFADHHEPASGEQEPVQPPGPDPRL